MKTTREYLPDIKIIEHAIKAGLLPIWENLEGEIGTKIAARISVHCGSVQGPSMLLHCILADDLQAEARIRFRQTFTERINRYFIEAIFRHIPSKPGFSGFTAEGRIILDDDSVSVEPRMHVLRYNVREWTGWI